MSHHITIPSERFPKLVLNTHLRPLYQPRTKRHRNLLKNRFTKIINTIEREKISKDDSNGIIDTDVLINKTYNTYNNQQLTLLMEASMNGQIDIVKALFERFNVTVDSVGDVEHFGLLIRGTTSLWCAVAYGHLEVVKTLIEHGANVNFLTKNKSCPLRTACFLGNLTIVKYLVQHGANVNITNLYNDTCLMIACKSNHKRVIRYLLMNGADINKQSNCGATAMHFVVQSNNLKLAKNLITFNPQQLKNELFMTPVMIAAERPYHDMVYTLLDRLDLTREEIIEAEELLGASILSNKKNYDFHLGYSILLNAMKKRFLCPIINKKVYKTVEYYNNKIECQTVQELIDIKDNVEAIHLEALIIRERILGQNNPYLLPSIMCHGRALNLKTRFLLWNHALKISIFNKLVSQGTCFLIECLETLCGIIKRYTVIELWYFKDVLQSACDLFILIKECRSENNDKDELKEFTYSEMLMTLDLIILTSNVLSTKCYEGGPEVEADLMKAILNIIKYQLKTEKGQTLLHLSLNKVAKYHRLCSAQIYGFPNLVAIQLLIYCGADVNAVDNDKNTPLHCIGKLITNLPHLLVDNDELNLKSIVMELLNAGAHTDFVNKLGDCPHTGYLSNLLKFTNNTPRSLKCLSASVVNSQYPMEYCNELPKELGKFTNLH